MSFRDPVDDEARHDPGPEWDDDVPSRGEIQEMDEEARRFREAWHAQQRRGPKVDGYETLTPRRRRP